VLGGDSYGYPTGGQYCEVNCGFKQSGEDRCTIGEVLQVVQDEQGFPSRKEARQILAQDDLGGTCHLKRHRDRGENSPGLVHTRELDKEHVSREGIEYP
jgi:hypothetical protein